MVIYNARKRRHFMRRYGVISIILCLLILLCFNQAAVEIEKRWIDYGQYIASDPLPYHGADFYTDQFINEVFSVGFVPDQDGWEKPIDHQGKYINVFNGWRITPNQPAQAVNTIYVFGSSTVFNREVPDWDTLPAQLQQLVGSRYRVENRGAWAGTTDLNLLHLMQTPIKAGDIVVFYGGQTAAAIPFNVAWNNAESQRPFWCSWNLQRIALLRLSCRINTIPPLLLDAQWLSSQVKTEITRYQDVLSRARQYTEQHNARFISVLQPYLWSQPLTAYEQRLTTYFGVVNPGLEVTYKTVFPQLKTLVDVDLSHVLDAPRQHGENFFLDYVHVNHVANRLIARVMFDVLFPS